MFIKYYLKFVGDIEFVLTWLISIFLGGETSSFVGRSTPARFRDAFRVGLGFSS